jgi:tetratricopeptide (TPR) repeat protein
MINAEELEKRWLKYKTKSFMLLFFVIGLMGSLIYGGYYILYKLKIDNRVQEHQPKPTATVVPTESMVEGNATNSTNKVSTTLTGTAIALAPIIPIVNLDRGEEEKQTVKRQIIKPKRKKGVKGVAREVIRRKSPPPNPTHTPKYRQKKRIEIRSSSLNYMSIMKEKFYKHKNPREAILIAKAYYRAGNYAKSEEWALRANHLNRSLDESWLLFAKSKNMLGEHEEAIKILRAYYAKSKSPKAKLLIKKLLKEK